MHAVQTFEKLREELILLNCEHAHKQHLNQRISALMGDVRSNHFNETLTSLKIRDVRKELE